MIEIPRPWKIRLVLILLALMAEMAFNAAVPLSLRFVIDQALTPHDYRALVKIILALTGGVVVVSGVGFWRSQLSCVLQSEVLSRLRQSMFDHLQRLPVASHARKEPGEVLSRFSGDLSSLETAMGMLIPWGIQPLCEAVIASVLLVLLDWRLAAGALILWPWTILAPRRVARRAADASAENKMRESELLGRLGENLAVQPLVKAFNLQSLMGAMFGEANRAVAQSSRQSSYLTSVMERSATSGILIIQVAFLPPVPAWRFRAESASERWYPFRGFCSC
jgi:ATP-binding cassette, subfamily B, bacterial